VEKSKTKQRQEAICRLRDYVSQPSYYRNMAHALVGDKYFELRGEECVNRVIDLLTDDDSLTEDDYLALLRDAAVDYYLAATDRDRWNEEAYIALPKDANGVPIHVGDELCGYGCPYGEVYCQAIINGETILVGGTNDAYEDWLMWSSRECKHFHITELMRLLVRMKDDLFDPYKDCDDVIAEYAKKLQIREDSDGEE